MIHSLNKTGLWKFTPAALLGVTFAASLLLAPLLVGAFPKPSVYPISWQLDFHPGTPTRIAVKVPGADVPKAYWYLPFTVTNNTDQEQQFLPEFDLYTNDGQVVRSDKNIPSVVFDAIRQKEHNSALRPLSKVTGKILLGEDQTRDSVAIWPEPENPRMGTFSIFVTGLSGETAILKDGEPADIKDWTQLSDEEKKKLVILHKTLQLNYQIAGDELYPGEDKVIDKGQTWVMR